MTDDNLIKWTHKKVKVREIFEERKNIYQKEVKNFNNFLEQNEIEYLAIKTNLKNDQNDKILFYIDILTRLNSIIKEPGESLSNTQSNMNKF